jgi:hypothetical protein
VPRHPRDLGTDKNLARRRRCQTPRPTSSPDPAGRGISERTITTLAGKVGPPCKFGKIACRAEAA